jgi:hypothetical protein
MNTKTKRAATKGHEDSRKIKTIEPGQAPKELGQGSEEIKNDYRKYFL